MLGKYLCLCHLGVLDLHVKEHQKEEEKRVWERVVKHSFYYTEEFAQGRSCLLSITSCMQQTDESIARKRIERKQLPFEVHAGSLVIDCIDVLVLQMAECFKLHRVI